MGRAQVSARRQLRMLMRAALPALSPIQLAAGASAQAAAGAAESTLEEADAAVPPVLLTCPPALRCATAEKSVYHKLERLIHAATGVEPRSWQEPLASWQEQERPGSATKH